MVYNDRVTSGPETPATAGSLSPDGLWRWDGTRWVSTGVVGERPAPPRPSRAWIWWVAGGCLVLVLIVIVGILVSGAALFNSLQRGGLTCLPADFPKYPGATVAGLNTYFGTNVAPGDSRECQMTLESNDGVSTVTDFYTGRLDSGDWTITANDTGNGVIRLSRKSRPATVGEIQLFGRGQHTEIQIRFDS